MIQLSLVSKFSLFAVLKTIRHLFSHLRTLLVVKFEAKQKETK